jgi:membrane-associated phospholipid phosphatase
MRKVMHHLRSVDGSLALLATAHLLAVGGAFGGLYQLSLRHAAQLANKTALIHTATAADAWVPFWPWSIVVYLSINFAYVAAFYRCRDEADLARLSQRLLAVQSAACLCFWLFPTQMLRLQPFEGSGWDTLYRALGVFDQPFNLAPSLHVGVVVVLWAQLCERCQAYRRWACHVWAVSVALSALFTWQHHLIDIALGLALGFVCLLPGSNRTN